MPKSERGMRQEDPIYSSGRSIVGMDGVAAAKKGERKIDELFGYRQLELAAPRNTNCSGTSGRVGRRADGVATVVLIVPGSGEDGRKVSLRSERSPNVSDCSDPISIIIIVVAVIQFGSRRRDADAITGGKKRRNGFTDLLQFDSDGRGQRSEEPHLSAFGDGGLTGVPDEILSDQVQSLDSNIFSSFTFSSEVSHIYSSLKYISTALYYSPLAPGQISEGEERELEQ